jgi:Holliday junction resolvasome RuvABC endonuclease subunit
VTRIVAADLSLTATGVAWVRPDGALEADLIRTRSSADLSDRLVKIAHELYAAAGFYPDLLVIEDVPFGAHGTVPVAMVHGAVRYRFHNHCPIVTVPAATLKRYATSKGNARKPDMLDAARSRLGWTGSNDDNIVDAIWLLAAGLDWYGEPLCPMPKANRDALAKVEWPVLRVEGDAA